VRTEWCVVTAVETDVVGYCRTLYSFAARSAKELSFSDNETIAIISKAFGMWWKGRLNDTACIITLCVSRSKNRYQTVA